MIGTTRNIVRNALERDTPVKKKSPRRPGNLDDYIALLLGRIYWYVYYTHQKYKIYAIYSYLFSCKYPLDMILYT